MEQSSPTKRFGFNAGSSSGCSVPSVDTAVIMIWLVGFCLEFEVGFEARCWAAARALR